MFYAAPDLAMVCDGVYDAFSYWVVIWFRSLAFGMILADDNELLGRLRI